MIAKVPMSIPLESSADGQSESLRGFWGKLRATVGFVPFSEEAAAAYFCAMDPVTPARVKAILVAALAYFILPADMIPDLIVGVGFTDDAAVFWAAWSAVSGHITEEHRSRACQSLGKSEASGRNRQN